MASQRDLELLDDYLANRMDDQTRAAFEEKINADQALKSEVELQQQLVSGIKQARIKELKGMLNNIPVPAAHTGAAVGAKVALSVAVAGLIAAGVYFYNLSTNETTNEVTKETSVDSTAEQPVVGNEETTNDETEAHEDSPDVSSQESSSEQKPVAPPRPGKKAPISEGAKKPEVFDPSKELEDGNGEPTDGNNHPQVNNAPAIAVEVDTDNKKYNFHYQFKDGKLFLYGPFEQGLYEILEIFSDDKRTLFLYYNENYYFLKTTSTSLKELSPIQDAELLAKLKEYRNK